MSKTFHLPSWIGISELSREYLQRFIQSRYFFVSRLCRRGAYPGSSPGRNEDPGGHHCARAISGAIGRGEPVAVQTLLDGTFPLHTDIARGYVIAINQAFTEERHRLPAPLRGLTQEQAGVLVHPLSVEVRYLYNEGGPQHLVHGAGAGHVHADAGLPLTALGVVREKETGSIYNIYSSTVTRAEFLTGKLLPYIVIPS